MSPQMKHGIRVFLATALCLGAIASSDSVWVLYAVVPVHAAVILLSAFLAAEQKHKAKIEAAHRKSVEEHNRWIAEIERKHGL